MAVRKPKAELSKSDVYTGVKVYECSKSLIDEIYSKKFISVPDTKSTWYPNQFIYLKANDTSEKSGAITTVSKDGKDLNLVKANPEAFGVKSKNKEQTMALQALLDEDIKLVTITGRAGSGKSILATAAAMQKMQERKYEGIIITRPMSQVGDYDLGALPGEIENKFMPYLQGYITNIQQLSGNKKQNTEQVIAMYNMEALPLQLIRGASWVNKLVICDEAQTMTSHEMLTLGTRIGEGSKLIVMGDLDQRDEDIKRVDTGLYKMTNSRLMKESPLTAHIDLIKTERSALADLFSNTFDEIGKE